MPSIRSGPSIRCRKCDERKDIGEFYTVKCKGKVYRRKVCKVCKRKRGKELLAKKDIRCKRCDLLQFVDCFHIVRVKGRKYRRKVCISCERKHGREQARKKREKLEWKECLNCGQVKQLKSFYVRAGARPAQVENTCKACRLSRTKERQNMTKAEHEAWMNAKLVNRFLAGLPLV